MRNIQISHFSHNISMKFQIEINKKSWIKILSIISKSFLIIILYNTYIHNNIKISKYRMTPI